MISIGKTVELESSKKLSSNKKGEQVEHPSHYNVGIEVWDYTSSHNLDFLEGNVIKYVTRWRHKNGLQDLNKAKQYLEKLIEVNSGK